MRANGKKPGVGSGGPQMSGVEGKRNAFCEVRVLLNSFA